MRFSLILLSFQLLTACCLKSVNMELKNRTTNRIHFLGFAGNTTSKDTLFTDPFYFQEMDSIGNLSLQDKHSTFGCKETDLETLRRHLVNDTLYLMFVVEDSLVKYGETQLMSDWNVNARYKLSSSDIDNLNYQIPYPPTPEMDFMDIVLR